MDIHIETTKEIETLLNSGTCINEKYYYLPFWFEKTDSGTFKVHGLDSLPKELVQMITVTYKASCVKY